MSRQQIPYFREKQHKTADGERATYYYWELPKRYKASGLHSRPLGGDRNKALQDHALLYRALQEWRKGKAPRSWPADSFGAIAAAYQKDELFTALAPKTQKEYKRLLDKHLLPTFGDIPIAKIEKRHARAFYHGRRDKPKQAADCVKVGRLVCKMGIYLGKIDHNPFSELSVKGSPRREIMLTDEEHKAFLAMALKMNRRSMWLAHTISMNIGLDTGDVRVLPVNAYREGVLYYSRHKNGNKVVIPIKEALPDLHAALTETEVKGTQFIIYEGTGKPYDEFLFGKTWREIADAAGIPKEKQFKDLRRGAVVKLRLADCSVADIADITGWTHTYCHQILTRYLPQTGEGAKRALLKLDSWKKQSEKAKRELEK